MEKGGGDLDWELWGLLLAGVSLLWNIVNSVLIEVNRKKSAKRAVQLEEFRSKLRGPIEAAVANIRTMRRRIQTLDLTKDEAALREKLKAENRELIEALTDLETALDYADKSKFADGEHWASMVSASGGDGALNQFDRAMNEANGFGVEELRNAYRAASTHLKELCEAVDAEVENQLSKFS